MFNYQHSYQHHVIYACTNSTSMALLSSYCQSMDTLLITIFVVFLCSCNWASEASPTLGCSIKISRDIYIYMLSVCRSMSVVCQINCVGGSTCGPHACSKSFFGG